MKTPKSTVTTFISLFLLVILITACGGVKPLPPTKSDTGTYIETSFDLSKDVNTKSFSSVDEFNNFVKNYQGASNYYGGGMVRTMAIGEMAMDSEQSASVPKVAPTPNTDYSKTNVQVEGIDEADIFKTDGKYIYTITDKTLFIIKAYPGEDAKIVSKIDFEDQPTSLFIDGDRMAVFGNIESLDFFKDKDFRPMSGMTFFDIYDISKKEDPKVIKEYKFEGQYFNGRMKGDYVYFVVQSSPQYRLMHPTPVFFEDGVMNDIAIGDIKYFDIPYQSPQFMTVHAINMDDIGKDIDSQVVIVEYGQNLYMSHDNIFITYTQTINEWELQQEIMKELLDPYLTDADRRVIEKIKKVDNEVMNQNEKEQKIMQIYYSYQNFLSREEQDDLQDRAEDILMEKLEEYEYFEFTVINKISINDGKISVEDNGKVPGMIINQFSMDENDGIFRIATTISQRWSRFDKERTESENHIYTLDEDLGIMDELTGLASGEQIYSTRFIDDRLYMVTFRQIDPFFVIDLSNPRNIKELGQLKIPGFSRYLHPYDEDTIIGIGQDATETGRTTGLKISLFDVSDVENPKEIAKYVTTSRYAQSTALYEHKAFLFDKDKELLVIPAYSYEYDEDRRQEGYNGAFVFKIQKDDIELRGLVDHSKSISNNRYYYQPAVERSLYIDELLYTKSPYLLRINELGDLDSIKDIELKTGSSGDIKVY